MSYGSDFLTSYGSGSGSTSQKVTVLTVPVPQHCVKMWPKPEICSLGRPEAEVSVPEFSRLRAYPAKFCALL
jgi:hypothetical protein